MTIGSFALQMIKVQIEGKEYEYQGLSCFATLEEVENMRDKYPKLGQYIYRCEKLEDFATIIDFALYSSFSPFT